MDLRGKKCLVTGGAGFLGTHLVERLLSLSADVAVFDIILKSAGSFLKLKALIDEVSYISGDVRIPKHLSFLVRQKFDYIFHLAAQPISELSNRETDLTMAINAGGTVNLCEAISSSKNNNLILASSACFYGAPPEGASPLKEEDASNPGLYKYSESKQGAERAVNQAQSLNSAIGRFVNVYGPGDRHFSRIIPRTIRQLIKKQAPALSRGKGETILDYLFVDDAVDGLIALAEYLEADKKNQEQTVFNFGIGTGHALSVNELVMKLSMCFDGKPREPVTPAHPFERAIVKYLDSSKAQELLSWQPKLRLNDGLPLTISWYQENIDKIQQLEDRQFSQNVGS